MIPLPDSFKANGYFYELMKRSGCVALFSQRNRSGVLQGYEVHVVQIRPDRTSNFAGRSVFWTCKEVPASNTQFGKYAWSFQHLENAQKKYLEIIAREEEKNELQK